jgi:hypothetical protein
MHKKLFLVLILFTLSFPGTQSLVLADGIPLQDRTELITTPPERAADMMTTIDEFVRGLSSFDLQSKTLSTGDVTVEQYLAYLRERPQEWTYEDVEKLKRVAASITKKLDEAGLTPGFPSTIEVIKTDMKEESGASAYTRLNYIAMGADMFNLSDNDFEKVFMHELFHILSRNNPELQEKVYNSIGFKKCNEVPYPEQIHRIANPDAPFNNYYINVGSADGTVEAMLIFYSDKDYEGGSFFRYAKLALMVVEGDDQNKKPVMKDGKPVILQLSDVTNFYEQVGRNTGYIIHPEELSADHFVILLNNEAVKDQRIIDDLKKLLLEAIK